MDSPLAAKLPFPLVYHERYDLNLGEHVFPARKYKLIRERLLAEGFAAEADFVSPEPAEIADLLRVHTREWVQKLRHGTLDYHEILKLEIPYSSQMVDGVLLATGGSILAARRALTQGVAYNVGGGFHHAFAGHGEGFCAINDIAVAVRTLQAEGAISKALIVDVDVHHGNGTAAIFAGDDSVFTLSIHQLNNYPQLKPPSTVDIHLADGAGDAEYLEKLNDAARVAIAGFQPDLLMLVAGADPYREDQLGGLSLSIDGLAARDRLVFDIALGARIPVGVVLAGGYAMDTDDTVTIHCNTARAAVSALAAAGGWRGRRGGH